MVITTIVLLNLPVQPYGSNHFTSRLFDRSGNTWEHDGIANGGQCIFEGKAKDIPSLSVLRNRIVCVAIYTSV